MAQLNQLKKLTVLQLNIFLQLFESHRQIFALNHVRELGGGRNHLDDVDIFVGEAAGVGRDEVGRLEVRQMYALRIAFVMSERDGLDVAAVHTLMLNVDEYWSVAEKLEREEVPWG